MWILLGVLVYLVTGMLVVFYVICRALSIGIVMNEKEDLGLPIRTIGFLGSLAVLLLVLRWPYDYIRGEYTKLTNTLINLFRKEETQGQPD